MHSGLAYLSLPHLSLLYLTFAAVNAEAVSL